MKKITTVDTMGYTRSYEVIEKIPKNFFVWNIGKNMGLDNYIPVCEDLHPEDKDDYHINTETVKAIKLDQQDVKKLRNAAAWGVNSLSTAKKAIRNKRRGNISNKKRTLAESTIEIFERITEM